MSISLAKTGEFLKSGYSDNPQKRIRNLGETCVTYIEGKPQQPNIPTRLRVAWLV